MKWMRGYGTKFVWNSVTSTLRAPSKRRDAVKEEITCVQKTDYAQRQASIRDLHWSADDLFHHLTSFSTSS